MLKILGQSAPSVGQSVNLYVVPTGYETVVSTLISTNRAMAVSEVRVAVRPGGEAITTKSWIYYDLLLPGRDTFAATLGISLAAGDVVTVWANTETVSFSLFGDEVAVI